VKRDGIWIELDCNLLVPGDLVKLTGDGAQIPADCIVHGPIKVNECPVTGEDMPCSKGKGSSVYWGSFIVSGETEATVTSTGTNTEWGQILLDLFSESFYYLEFQEFPDAPELEMLSRPASRVGLTAAIVMFVRGFFLLPRGASLSLWLNIILVGPPH
jgi:magnesium-transporting ATPase (P-type)